MAQQTPLTIAFFGSTGGSCRAALIEVLRAGHHARALLHTPSKLVLDEGCPVANLTVVQGDVKDFEKVGQVIDGCDVIISGIGTHSLPLYLPLTLLCSPLLIPFVPIHFSSLSHLIHLSQVAHK
jgi:hypothetical protein